MKIGPNPFSINSLIYKKETGNSSKIDFVPTKNSKNNEPLERLLSLNAPKVTNPITNSIDIKHGETRNLGYIDGNPLNVYFDSYGINTSFDVMINANEPINSSRTQLSFMIFNKYSPTQKAKAGSITSRFEYLYKVADGAMSVKDYNSLNLGKEVISTKELLTTIGIDITKPFTFNDKSFFLDPDGELHAFLPPNY